MPFITLFQFVLIMILSVVLGFLWYGPFFGKKWMTLANIPMPTTKPSFGMMLRPMLFSMLGAFFMSFVLASIIAFHGAYYGVSGYASALSLAILVWLGFIVPSHLNVKVWEGKSWTLFFINTGYWLVFLLISSIVLVAF